MPLDQDYEDEPGGEKEMSFLDHLEELRWHIIRSLVATAVFTVVAFFNVKWVFQNIILRRPKLISHGECSVKSVTCSTKRIYFVLMIFRFSFKADI